jgi:hypothetical protein
VVSKTENEMSENVEENVQAAPAPAPEGQISLGAADNCFVRAQKITAFTGLASLARYGVDKAIAEVIQAYMDVDRNEFMKVIEQMRQQSQPQVPQQPAIPESAKKTKAE